jgi:hypothetical protein
MPGLIQELGALPLLKSKRRQESFGYYLAGLGAYLLACEHFKKGLQEDDIEALDEGKRQINLAGDLMDKSWELSKL